MTMKSYPNIVLILKNLVMIIMRATKTNQKVNSILEKNKETKWMQVPPSASRTRQENIITERSGPKGGAINKNISIEQALELFIDQAMLEMMLKHTNEFIQKVRPNFKDPNNARDTDIPEIKAYIGLLLLIGEMRSNHRNIADLWSDDGCGVEFLRCTMSYQRFLFISRCLRFDDADTRDVRRELDKLAPIRDFFDRFVDHCKTYFSASECVTIDESMFPFKGRCAFRMYMPAKPHRYGLKLYSMVDSATFYVLNCEMYLGKQNGNNPVANTPSAVVLRLIQPITGTGRNVTTDNWYTSIPLASSLLTDHRLTTVGTVRKNRKELPPQFTATRGREQYSSLFGFTKDMTLVSYIPKKGKVVNILSTMHHDNKIDVATKDKLKPEIITFYNGTKGGVDTNDELCGTYSVCRRTRRWPHVIFQNLLNIAGVNALIIYKANHTDYSDTRMLFLKNMGRSLCMDHLRIRATKKEIPRSLRQSAGRFSGVEESNQPEDRPGGRQRCAYCPRDADRKTKTYCTTCGKAVCALHQEMVASCKSCCEAGAK